MILQHNLGAANASRQFNCVFTNQGKGAEKLSTGYRINRAADDAAGLTISESMRYMIRGMGKASDNAQHGISLLQTADGALNESQQVIQRIRELSVQAANDTNTESDRRAIQKEVTDMLSEVDRIANDTEFNTIRLLDGTLEAVPYQNSPFLVHGMRSADPMQQAFPGILADPVVGSGVKLNNTQVAGLNDVLVNSIVPHAVNAFLDTFPVFQSAAGSNQVSNQIGLKLYGDSSTTLASVSIKYGSYSDGTIAGDMIQLNLSVNTRALSFSGDDLTPESRKALETTIVHEMMHAFMDDTLTNGMIGATNGKKDSTNQFPGWFKEGMAQCAAGGCANCNDWVNGALNINENSTIAQISTAVTSSANRLSSDSTASRYGTGYLACMYLGYLAAGKPAVLDSAGLAGGINQIFSKLMNGDSLNNIIKDVSGGAYTSITDFRNKFGDNASSEFISKLLKAVGSTGNGGVVAPLTADDLLSDNNTTSSVYKVDDTKEFVVSSVGSNRNWGTGGASKTGSSYTGGSGGGAGTGTGTGGGGTGTGTGGGGTGAGPAGVGFAGALHLQIGAREGNAFSISIDDMHASVLGLENISVMSFDDAGMAITTCDDALTRISENRSRIGAYINRLEYAVNNLDNTTENTQAAESLIRDTDMAEQMVDYSKNQILVQAGQSIISHAIRRPESVLALLG